MFISLAAIWKNASEGTDKLHLPSRWPLAAIWENASEGTDKLHLPSRWLPLTSINS